MCALVCWYYNGNRLTILTILLDTKNNLDFCYTNEITDLLPIMIVENPTELNNICLSQICTGKTRMLSILVWVFCTTFASLKTQNVNQVEPGPDSYKISQDCLLIRWPRYLYFSQGKLGILCSDFNWHSCIAICMLNWSCPRPGEKGRFKFNEVHYWWRNKIPKSIWGEGGQYSTCSMCIVLV